MDVGTLPPPPELPERASGRMTASGALHDTYPRRLLRAPPYETLSHVRAVPGHKPNNPRVSGREPAILGPGPCSPVHTLPVVDSNTAHNNAKPPAAILYPKCGDMSAVLDAYCRTTGST
jgi:hypothetical protein